MLQGRLRPSNGASASLAIHAAALLLLITGLGMRARFSEPTRLPGTASGQRMLLSYSPGGQPQAGAPSTRKTAAPRVTPKPVPKAPTPAAIPSPLQLAETGPGASGPSGQGDGDIRIALPQFNPRPTPDLSSLPHGTSGNVVVDVVIDATGKVTQLTLVKGLGNPIDAAVLGTVHTWIFTPATKDGQVIASEQEILVHYDRG